MYATRSNEVSTIEAARLLGVSRTTAWVMVQDGRLDGRRVGKHWVAKLDSVLRLRARNRRVKRLLANG